MAVSPLVDERTPLTPLVATYVVAGALMAFTVAVATGLCWFGWLSRGGLPLQSAETLGLTNRPWWRTTDGWTTFATPTPRAQPMQRTSC